MEEERKEGGIEKEGRRVKRKGMGKVRGGSVMPTCSGKRGVLLCS